MIDNQHQPHPYDKSHIRLSYITHFYCNQTNIDSVTELLRHYEQYDPALLDVIEFVIVDDGSPVEYEIPQLNLNITWLRINEDIQWNQAGARNLGVTYAKSDRIVLSDLDHLFPPETLHYMAYRRHPGRSFFKVYRTDEQGQRQTGHSNLFYMSRARFMRFFGYDEDFAGHYGAEDYRFVKFQKHHGSRQRYLPARYRCFERQKLNRKTSYHSLNRSLAYNTPVDARKKQEIEQHGREFGHSRLFLNFTWHVKAVFLRPAPVKPSHKLWKHLWWFRYLSGYLAR